jgi:ribosome-binding factor A
MSTIFQQNMSVLFKGTMISVTNVRVSPDLGVCKIYLSFFPVEQREPGMMEVKAQTTNLRRLLGDKVGKQLRKIPELQFFLDDSLDYYEEIDRLLKKK